MSAQPTLELAGIFRQYGPAYRQARPMPPYQLRMMHAIETCRDPELGSIVEWRDHRSLLPQPALSQVPKAARAKWLEQRKVPAAATDASAI